MILLKLAVGTCTFLVSWFDDIYISIYIFYGHDLSQIFSAKEEKEEIKREAVDRQALLKQQMDSRKNHHRDIMKKKMQERKRKKIGALPEKHARETAKVRPGNFCFF